jgi:hypothetical protein
MQSEGHGVFHVHLKFKAESVNVPVRISDTAKSVFEFIEEIFAFESEFVKLIFRGKQLAAGDELTAAGVKEGSKLMLVASQRADVVDIQSQRSDPTIRGFSNERGAREEAMKQANTVDPSVGWAIQQHKAYKFCRFKPLDFSGLTPHAFDAEKLLKKLATDPGIVDIMVEYEWTVRD